MKSKLFYRISAIVKWRPLARLLAGSAYLMFAAAYFMRSLFTRRRICEGERPLPAAANCAVALPAETRCDLSVIIPAYNSAHLLGECIASVLSQSTRYGVQVIVVDDGSDDGTGELLKELKLFDRITYIRIENSGQGYARNRGLEASYGKRIMFLDADDRLCDGAIDLLMSYEEDIVQGGFEYMGGKKGKRLHAAAVFTDREKILSVNCYGEGYPWGKVYRRELFSPCGFPERVHFEDNNLSFLVLPAAKSWRYVPKPVVYYRVHAGQETANVVKRGFGGEQVAAVATLYGEAVKLFPADGARLRSLAVYNLTTALLPRLGAEGYEEAFLRVAAFTESAMGEFKPRTLKERKFLKAVKTRDLNMFVNVCRYL